MALNEKHSYQDYTGQSLAHLPPEEFSGTTIVGSCFSQETPTGGVFPEGTNDLAIDSSNCDNVFPLPPGSVFLPAANSMRGVECSHRRFRVQNDLEHWQVDEADKPLVPLALDEFVTLGISTSPRDIPAEKMAEPLTIIRGREKQAEDEAAVRTVLEDAGIDPSILGVRG